MPSSIIFILISPFDHIDRFIGSVDLNVCYSTPTSESVLWPSCFA